MNEPSTSLDKELGPLPAPAISYWGDFTAAQMDAERKRCYAIGFAKGQENKDHVKIFEMTHRILGIVTMFTETDAPDWLTSANTRKGSTMDGRWFWQDHVLTLKVGEHVGTDFQRITRVA